MPAADQDLRVTAWIKVFIPEAVPGAIDGVGSAHGRRLLVGPCAWFTDCLHTDDRGFSADIAAPCRMHSEFALDLATQELRQHHYCGETVEYDCDDGDIECRATADTSRMRFSGLRWRDHDALELDVLAAATNPCLGGSPALGFAGTFTIDLAHRALTFDGRVKPFPAYEAYVTVNGGTATTLFTLSPRGTVTDLAAPATDPVRASIHF
ncbi:MAG TPA: DUF3238 domain-containing protein [Pseudonocardiaceae bacterium]